MRKKCVLMTLLSILFVLALKDGHAADNEFYKGKTMTVVVCTKPGGGYDFYGRLIAQFMQKYLPGSTIIVKNVPGAGHVVGVNEIYHAKPNGLVFGTFNRALAMTQVAQLKGVKFDLSKMSWLGSPTSEMQALIISAKSPFKTLEDLVTADQVRFASQGLGSLSHVNPMIVQKIIGAKNWKLVTGYGGGESELAMMRGEIDAQFASWGSLTSFVKQGNGFPVMFIGKKQPEGYENVPLLKDINRNEKDKPAISLLNTINILGRPYAGPPGIPEDRLKILREAFKKACDDPELKKLAEKSEVAIDFVGSAEAEDMMTELLNLPQDLAKLVKQSYKTD